MALTHKKTDKLEKLFEQFAIDPDGDVIDERSKDMQQEADKFLKKEQEVLAKKQAENEEK